MSMTLEGARRLKEIVREAVEELALSDEDPDARQKNTIIVWNVVRDAFGKSYLECEDSDIPVAENAIKFFLEGIKNERRR